jgi:NTE family protein
MTGAGSLARTTSVPLAGRIGIALGSGAARGWAHIGVLRGLEEAGVAPDLVCGTSVGAVVGAAYASGRLDAFERWVRALDRSQVVRNLDVAFRGGLIKAARFFQFMAEELPDVDIESLPRPFAAVATDLESGREAWLREGSLHDALRASVAMPGLITPVARRGRWMVDGGLTNPVPVSLCRAMGADSVVAVDLNTTLLARRFLQPPPFSHDGNTRDVAASTIKATEDGALEGSALWSVVQSWAGELRSRLRGDSASESYGPPSIYDVVANSLSIMQVRVTRSRMAGDPPDLLVAPKLASFALLDIDRAAEAIEEGRRALAQALASSG